MPTSPFTVADALAWACTQGLDRLDGHLLLSHLLERPRTWLLAHSDTELDAATRSRFEHTCLRRAQGEPLAYIVGEKEFFGLALQVSPAVLVPRPDTETLVQWALSTLAEQPVTSAAVPTVLDLGTGSGAIALAIAHAHPAAQVTAVDASEAALAIAQTNARALGLTLRFALGSWFAPVAGQRFDLIVSNPPYIAEGDPHLPALQFEPRQALTAGPDGLDDLRQIIAQAPAHLSAGGWLLLEHGYDQAVAVTQLLHEQGFEQVSTHFDLGEQPRCTGGKFTKTCPG